MVKLQKQPDFTWKIPNPQGTWIIIPDRHHAPDNDPEGGVDPKAWSCALQGIGLIKPDGLVDLGDIGEWSSVSPWKYKRRKRPPVKDVMANLERDLTSVWRGQDQLDEAALRVGCRRKVQLQGNHELWIDNMIEEWQEQLGSVMRAGMSTQGLLELKQRKYAYVPYGDYIKLGDLFLYHGGHFNSQKYHAAQHLRELSASVMYGHYHDYQVAKTGLLGKGLHAAWSIGFLGKPRKPFMRGKPTNWSHNFAIVHVERNGHFHVEIVEIFDGVCYVQGKKVTG
jgi:hypothetical protein